VAIRPPVPGTGSAKRQDANPIIIQQERNIGGTAGNPTPTLPAYIVGVWVSVMNPAASGAEQVYVRVTKNTGTAANEPAPNVKVQVTSPYGVARSIMTTSPPQQGGKGGGAAPANTAITDSSGLAIFIFFYGAAPGTAVPVYASATINGHQVSSNTTFVIA
jgi:hypothetical protein